MKHIDEIRTWKENMLNKLLFWLDIISNLYFIIAKTTKITVLKMFAVYIYVFNLSRATLCLIMQLAHSI